MTDSAFTASEIIARFALEPLPVEGGLFRQWYRSSDLFDATSVADRYDPEEAKPAGTAIVAMLTDDPDSFSAWHQLRTDELWHFYLGDPVEVVTLHPGGTSRHVTLGHDLTSGHVPFTLVSRGTPMAARLVPGGRWGLFGNTMAPGFTSNDFEGCDPTHLLAHWPHEAALIGALSRSNAPRHMPPGL